MELSKIEILAYLSVTCFFLLINLQMLTSAIVNAGYPQLLIAIIVFISTRTLSILDHIYIYTKILKTTFNFKFKLTRFRIHGQCVYRYRRYVREIHFNKSIITQRSVIVFFLTVLRHFSAVFINLLIKFIMYKFL